MLRKLNTAMFLLTILCLSACSQKSLPVNTQCESLPTFIKEDFRWVRKNLSLVNKLKQTKSIKDCSCLEPSQQEICFKKFID